MKNNRNIKQIYILRARCSGSLEAKPKEVVDPSCSLDKMVLFYRVPNATPRAMAEGHKKVLRQRFREHYGCPHAVLFDLEIDKQYVWDVENKKPIKRSNF